MYYEQLCHRISAQTLDEADLVFVAEQPAGRAGHPGPVAAGALSGHGYQSAECRIEHRLHDSSGRQALLFC